MQHLQHLFICDDHSVVVVSSKANRLVPLCAVINCTTVVLLFLSCSLLSNTKGKESGREDSYVLMEVPVTGDQQQHKEQTDQLRNLICVRDEDLVDKTGKQTDRQTDRQTKRGQTVLLFNLVHSSATASFLKCPYVQYLLTGKHCKFFLLQMEQFN